MQANEKRIQKPLVMIFRIEQDSASRFGQGIVLGTLHGFSKGELGRDGDGKFAAKEAASRFAVRPRVFSSTRPQEERLRCRN
jgi:hypothetical protein